MPSIDHLPILVLLAVFLAASGAIWVAGIQLSNVTDILSERLKLGQALGGAILLAIATNLPEIAIVGSASVRHELGVAVGNILGGIAIQTVVLVVLDAFGARRGPPLSYISASLALVLEAALVIAVLIVAVMGTQLPASLMWVRVTPGALLIVALWIVGVWLLSEASKGLPWHDTSGAAPKGQAKPKGHSRTARAAGKMSTGMAAAIFAGAALVTLLAGVALEESGSGLAAHFGLSGVLFGATVLAAATALPELSTGLAAMKLGDYQLAVSDIFGGNAFLPVLFLLASLLSGQAVLPQAEKTDIYLAALGILLTTVYLAGLIFRPQRRILGMGVDSLVVLVLYGGGVAGLVAIAQAGPH